MRNCATSVERNGALCETAMQPTGSKAAGHPDIDRLERGRLLDQRHFEMLTSPEPQLAHWKGRGGGKPHFQCCDVRRMSDNENRVLTCRSEEAGRALASSGA